MIHDIQITGGNVFNSETGQFEKCDIFISNGLFAAYEKGDTARNIINASDKAVIPGLIDEHLHIDINGSMIGANADTVCIPNGITSCCDGGTCGVSNFPQFYNSNLIRYEAHCYSFLNISTFGNKSLCIHNENHDPADFREDLIENTFRKYHDVIRGLKVRMCKATLENYGMSPLYKAIEISEHLQRKNIRCPVIVHYDDLPDNVTVKEIFDSMRAGDTVAHIFQTHGETIFLEDGKINPSVIEAQKRGVYIDDCHGRVHWSIPNLKQAHKLGFKPDIISSDTVRISEYVHPGFSLLYAMTIQSACGMSTEDILQCVTINPARALGIEDRAGKIESGKPADITILDIADMKGDVKDNWGNVTKGNKIFIPLLTMISGRVAYRQIYF